jgi:hypothetical protein
MNDHGMEDIKKFRTALHRLMASDDGKIVAEGLTRMYVEQSALGDNELQTAYRLGQKEFVQGILADAAKELTF